MTDITIPPEALQKAWEKYLIEGCGPYAFEAACLAMLKAWPGSYSLTENDSAEIRDVAAIILPLPKEKLE